MAPELVKNQTHGTAVDIWAVGITAYFLLTYGANPFPGITKAVVDDKIKNYEPDFNKLDAMKFKPSAKEFIRKCLAKDKESRPSAQTLLLDEWFLPEVQSPALARKSTLFRTVNELNDYHEMNEF